MARRAERQGLLRVHAPAPEHQARAVLALQFGRVHARRRALHGVHHVETGLEEALEETLDAAAGMFETFPGCMRMHPVVDALVVREPKLAKGGDRAECRGLGAEIGAADV